MEIWFRALESDLDKVDLEILQRLTGGSPKLQEVLIDVASKEISKDLGLPTKAVKNRIAKIRKAKVFEKIIAQIDPMKIWNYLFFVFMKADLTPPLIGVPLEYPSSWTDLVDYIKEMRVKSDLARSMIRLAVPLQGTDWDILLLVSTNDRRDLLDLCNELVASKFVEKIWSFSPVEGGGYIFDLVGIPAKDEFEKRFEKPIRKGVELLDKRF